MLLDGVIKVQPSLKLRQCSLCNYLFCRDLCGAVLSEKLRASLAVSNALPDSLPEKHTVGADFHNSFSRLSPGGDAFFCL